MFLEPLVLLLFLPLSQALFGHRLHEDVKGWLTDTLLPTNHCAMWSRAWEPAIFVWLRIGLNNWRKWLMLNHSWTTASWSLGFLYLLAIFHNVASRHCWWSEIITRHVLLRPGTLHFTCTGWNPNLRQCIVGGWLAGVLQQHQLMERGLMGRCLMTASANVNAHVIIGCVLPPLGNIGSCQFFSGWPSMWPEWFPAISLSHFEQKAV